MTSAIGDEVDADVTSVAEKTAVGATEPLDDLKTRAACATHEPVEEGGGGGGVRPRVRSRGALRINRIRWARMDSTG